MNENENRKELHFEYTYIHTHIKRNCPSRFFFFSPPFLSLSLYSFLTSIDDDDVYTNLFERRYLSSLSIFGIYV